jgi:hypothetical protein
MKGIEVHIDREPPGTSDPGDQDDFILLITDAIDGPDEGA